MNKLQKILIVLLPVVISACASHSASIPADWQQYENKELGIAFAYPPEYKVEKEPRAYADMLSISYPSVNRGIIIAVRNVNNASLEETTTTLLKNPEFKLVGSKSFGNTKWTEFTYDSAEGTNMRHKLFYLGQNGKIQIQADLEDIAYSPADVVINSEQVKKNLESMMTSLRVVE
jgi:hypothetical protein